MGDTRRSGADRLLPAQRGEVAFRCNRYIGGCARVGPPERGGHPGGSSCQWDNLAASRAGDGRDSVGG